MFDLLELNLEEKQSALEGWEEYKVDEVRGFFLVLRERYLALVENSGEEEN